MSGEGSEMKHGNRVRGNRTSKKYPRTFIIGLKAVFDEYDADGSGTISQAELYQAMRKRKGNAGHDMAAFHESIFEAIDKDTSGEIDFEELLKVILPHATERELLTMMSWVQVKEVPAKKEDPLSEDDREEIHAMFTLYDTDKSNDLSLSEMQAAFGKVLSSDEVMSLFHESDIDHNGRIDMQEFTNMIVSTGLYYVGS